VLLALKAIDVPSIEGPWTAYSRSCLT
jgi:hypothetical protein